jgi:cupin fold WbuC family metalloprotein
MHIIDREFMDRLSAQAKASERKRAHFNLHESLDEDIHRLCMGAEPGTFIRPHRHLAGDKWELFTILRGKIVVLIFDDEGKVLNRVEMTAGGDTCVIEIPATSWHAFASMQSGSIVMEVKRGPYARPVEEDWMQRAPAEGEAGAGELQEWYQSAQVGDKLP